jgi:hypothetical protein
MARRWRDRVNFVQISNEDHFVIYRRNKDMYRFIEGDIVWHKNSVEDQNVDEAFSKCMILRAYTEEVSDDMGRYNCPAYALRRISDSKLFGRAHEDPDHPDFNRYQPPILESHLIADSEYFSKNVLLGMIEYEQDKYRTSLLDCTKENLILRSTEISVRRELRRGLEDAIKSGDLTEQEQKLLIKSGTPIRNMYIEWHGDDGIGETLLGEHIHERMIQDNDSPMAIPIIECEAVPAAYVKAERPAEAASRNYGEEMER